MLAIHKFRAQGICPIDESVDYYKIEVYLDRFIKCEDVVEITNKLLSAPTFQENFTQSLSDELGCKVRTTVLHTSSCVKLVCTCSPALNWGN